MRTAFHSTIMALAVALCATSAAASEAMQQHAEQPAFLGDASDLVGAVIKSAPPSSAVRRKTELGECFLSHVLHSRIEVSCDEDLFFAPLHRSFYASLFLPKKKGG